MGVTERGAELAWWGVNAIPEDDREERREGAEEDEQWTSV
jgi:hypothetical protein